MRRRSRWVAAAVGLAVGGGSAVTAGGAAAQYPPPSRPTATVAPPHESGRTLHVCRGRRTCFPRIQDAVNEARPGDTIRVAHGTWREGVRIVGRAKRSIRLIGDPRAPAKVILDADRPDGRMRDGIRIEGADQVTVDGFTAQHYARSGFVAVGVTGYRFAHLRALEVAGAGIVATRAVGGSMSDAEARGNGGAGFAIGSTPLQSRPVRTLARRLQATGNAVGWWGSNARYVTLQESTFSDNGAGVVLAARQAAGVPPSEDDVVTGNAVFANNLGSATGVVAPSVAPGEVPALTGVGILLLGGRRIVVTGNEVHGNRLMGVGLVAQALAATPEAGVPVGNQVADNRHGLVGADPNGRDLLYDGSGADNCVALDPTVASTVPADRSTFAACPFAGPNAFSAAAATQGADLLAAPLAQLVP